MTNVSYALKPRTLKFRVRPYYIFHAKRVVGTTHLTPPLMMALRSWSTCEAIPQESIPTYIINAPQGHGKTPIAPEYLLSRGKNTIKIRTWEDKVFDYPNRPTPDMKSFF